MQFERIWTYESKGPVSGTPTVINTTDGARVILGTDNGSVICIDGTGCEQWRDTVGTVLHGWPIETNDGFVIGDNVGTVHAYGYDGSSRWRTSVGDLERPLLFNSGITPWTGISQFKDSDANIVVTDKAGQVSALSAEGKLVWQVHTTEPGDFQCIGKPAVADLDGDGFDEIVVSAFNGRAYCIGSDGSFRWSTDVIHAEGGYHSPFIMDWGEGPRVLMIGNRQGRIRCLSPDGSEIWAFDSGGAISVHSGISPVLVDGVWHILIVQDKSGQFLITTDGEMVWSRWYAGGSGAVSPSVADIDGDGELELLFLRRDTKLMRVLDVQGNEKAQLNLDGPMDGSPVIADIDNDGIPEFVVVNRATGRCDAYRVMEAVPGGVIPWPSTRGPFNGRGSLEQAGTTRQAPVERQCSGSSSITRSEPDEIRTGDQTIVWSVDDGEMVETSVTGPDSVRHIFPRRVSDTVHGRINADKAGSYQLGARALDAAGSCIGSYSETISVSPFDPERRHGESLLGELDALLERIRETDSAVADDLRTQTDSLRYEWIALTNRAEKSETATSALVNDVCDFLRRAERLVRVAELAQQHREETGDAVEFLVWQPEHPWVSFDPTYDVPQAAKLSEVRVATDRGGHEATVLEIANVTAKTLSVRVWLDSWSGDENAQLPNGVDLRQQVFIATARHNIAPDALPRLNEAGILTIASGESVRLWIDWNSGDATPGTYQSALHLRALTVPSHVESLPLTWEVSPLELPAESPLKFHMWAYESAGIPFTDAVYRDLAEHYVNVYDLPLPAVKYDADGNLQPIDWTRTDNVIERVAPNSFFLWTGRDNIVQPMEGAPPTGEPAWQRAFETFVRMFVEHLRERGIGYDQHANYIIDEPGIMGGERVDIHERTAKLYHSVDPKIQMFANPAGGATDAHIDRLLAYSTILDPIWQYPGEYPHVHRILDTAPIVWTYACGEGAKDRRRMEYYWAPIWRGAQLGMTGIGFWSYAGRSIDMWQGPVPNGCDWELVYPGDGTVVPSHRWQGLRIGIEDRMRLELITEAAKTARVDGDPIRAKKLESFRDECIRRVVDSGHDEGVAARVREEMRGVLLGE